MQNERLLGHRVQKINIRGRDLRPKERSRMKVGCSKGEKLSITKYGDTLGWINELGQRLGLSPTYYTCGKLLHLSELVNF